MVKALVFNVTESSRLSHMRSHFLWLVTTSCPRSWRRVCVCVCGWTLVPFRGSAVLVTWRDVTGSAQG